MNDERKVDVNTNGDIVLVDPKEWTLRRYMRAILWVTVVLFVVAFVGMIRSFQTQTIANRLEDSTKVLSDETQEAKDAAVEARDTLQAAIDRGRQSAVGSEAVLEALQAIARIENHLCGGPCDG